LRYFLSSAVSRFIFDIIYHSGGTFHNIHVMNR
jgi:hypothetical protein